MNDFIRQTVSFGRSRVEWIGSTRAGRGRVFWCADGDGFVTVLSNRYHNALFDQGHFIAWLPKDKTEALQDATMWLANEYPRIYRDIREQ
jgi:hypothetical protein